MNDITSVIIVAGVLALLGAVMLWRGWRGKRVGDHPYCRRCGFNLFGSAADAKVCPECGADLSVPRAIVIGVRQRRVGLAMGGVGMLLPAVLVLLTIIGASVSGVDWTKHKPPWLLNREASSADTLIRDAALAELMSRFAAGTLSNAHVASTVEAGLKYQGRADLPWSVAWGDFIEAARRKGLVSEEQWARYAKQAVSPGSFKLTLRERVHPGDPVAYALETSSNDRVGRTSRLFKVVRINGVTLDGTEMMPQPGNGAMAVALAPGGGAGGPGGLPVTSVGVINSKGGLSGGFSGTMVSVGGGTRTSASSSSRGTLEVDPAKMQQLAAGIHSGELRLEVKVTPTPPMRTSRSITIPANADPTTLQKLLRDRQSQTEKEVFRAAEPVLADVEVKMPVKLEVLKADEPTVRRVDDEKLRREVEDSITVSRVRVLPSRASVLISCMNPPTDLAYAVFLRQGEKEWPVGTVAFKHGGGPLRWGGSASTDSGFIPPGEEPTGSSVDVVLRPDPSAALANPDIDSYWGGEVVVKNVPMDQNARPVMAQSSAYADALNTLRLGSAMITPPAVVTAPNADGRGLMLKIEIRKAGNGNAASTAPAAADGEALKPTCELLVYPNSPFLQRTVENGTTTTISGVVSSGSDTTHFNVELEYTTATKDDPTPARFRNSRSNVSLDQTVSIGRRSGEETKWITLSLPRPSRGN